MSFSLNGLASGLDTATIISQLMQLERLPYQKMQTKKNTINSELSIFRSINTKLSALRTAAQDLTLGSSFDVRRATVSDEAVIKATASETAQLGNYTINVTQLATKHSVKSVEFATEGEDLKGEIGNEVEINGRTYTLAGDGEDESNEAILTNLMNQVNADQDSAVNASIIRTSTDGITFVLTAKESGVANAVDFNEFPSDPADPKFGFTQANEAQDAMLEINGVTVTSSSNQLNDVLPGISLTLLKDGEATIDIAQDVDKITDKVDSFVKAYNDVINTIRSNNSEGRNLQGDSTLRSLQSHLFNLFNREVGGNTALNYMFDIGLEIDRGQTKGSEMTGTISFDKEKFQTALAENPDEVFNLFAQTEENHPGIAKLFGDSLMDWTRSGSGIITSRIDGYDSEISFLNKQMEDMDTRLIMKEESLKRQFTAMESALIQLQNQQAWMASQLASMGI